MAGTAATACLQFQSTLRAAWASGSAMVEITTALGITKDQLIRLRGVLQLPLRLDRAARARPAPSTDPTPAEIAERAAAVRAAWDARTEEARRGYKATPLEARVVSGRWFECAPRPHAGGGENVENLVDRLDR